MARARRPDGNRRFWSRYAKLYDFEINRTSQAAYQQMYRWMGSVLSPEMEVLEVATGTGLIACHVARYVSSVQAIDFSPGMIAAANRKDVPDNVHFSLADATALPFEDSRFDAAIISNALHIMPDPVLALANIKRVLKPGGLLIAPNFSQGHINHLSWKINAALLAIIGFEAHAKWTPEEYRAFISDNGFHVDRWQVLPAAFPLVYLEAHAVGE